MKHPGLLEDAVEKVYLFCSQGRLLGATFA
jgi:hypothetical protein